MFKHKRDNPGTVMQTSVLLATTALFVEKRAYKKFLRTLPHSERSYFVARDGLVGQSLTVMVFPTAGTAKDISSRAKFIKWMEERNKENLGHAQWAYTEVVYGNLGIAVNIGRTNCAQFHEGQVERKLSLVSST